MKILVVGATGSIGLHVVKTAMEMGRQPKALVRNRRKVKQFPHEVDVFYGDVSMLKTLAGVAKDIDTVISTPSSDRAGSITTMMIGTSSSCFVLSVSGTKPCLRKLHWAAISEKQT
ncbi:NAD(P)H-binding protein [Dickeya fangzhongdai]|nr:NAD(P)H-binding protein [Dickeya fangzhongdai]